ncbi:MAG: amino acid ABC transporter substrate-binding protein [Deferribacteraceae bacterium]|jgi:polar amino acid transport system substrate-binding protein|nr:amino acid ABC transporter substrate-binding protein [Deferribacteraceae bacterium]
MKRVLLLMVFMAILLAAFAGCKKNRQTDQPAQPVQSEQSEQFEGDQSFADIQQKGKFIMGFDDSFPPMGFKENGEYVGFDIDLAREVTKRLGVELVLQPIIWDVKEQELNTGKIDCIWNGFTMTPEREAALTFTKPYMNNKQVVIVPAASPVQTLSDLNGKKLALQRDSSAFEALNKFPEVKNSLKELLQFEDNLMAMTDLDTGNCDAVLMDIIVANFNYIAKNPDKYRILDESMADERFGVGFRKSDVTLKDKVEAALVEMANDGSMSEISDKWFGDDITTLK